MRTAAPQQPSDLYRALDRAETPLELRDAESTGDMPTLFGRFAVFGEWTEIYSWWEGDFMERIDPGAFDRTFKEDRGAMRVLFQHGADPYIGNKPLGPIDDLGTDSKGANYAVPLLDAAYNRDHLLPGLRAGLYGASFRFRVEREEWVDKPDPSKANPRGMRERTILDATVLEFGPVTFPAYSGATAGVRSACRSLTDLFHPAGHVPAADLTGAPSGRTAGRGDPRDAGQRGAHRPPSPTAAARHRRLLLDGVIDG